MSCMTTHENCSSLSIASITGPLDKESHRKIFLNGRYNLPLNDRSITHPAAIRAAEDVCISFQVVSRSTPMPPQCSITKLLMGRSANILMSSRVRFRGLVPAEKKQNVVLLCFTSDFRAFYKLYFKNLLSRLVCTEFHLAIWHLVPEFRHDGSLIRLWFTNPRLAMLSSHLS